jgi:hypothetical protein
MDINERIKELIDAIDNGLKVFWRYDNYELVKLEVASKDPYFIHCKETDKNIPFRNIYGFLAENLDIRDFYIFQPISASEARKISETAQNKNNSKILAGIFEQIRRQAKFSNSLNVMAVCITDEIVNILRNEYNFSVEFSENKLNCTISWA